MSTITRTPTGYKVRWREGSGGRAAPSRSKTFTTRAEAERFAAGLVLSAGKSGGTRAGRVLVREYADGWVASIWQQTTSEGSGGRHIAATSAGTYQRNIAHVVAILGDHAIGDVTVGHCKDLLIRLSSRLAVNTVSGVRLAARKMFSDAVDRGYIAENPMPTEGLFKPNAAKRQGKRRAKAPTEAQVAAMVAATEKAELKTLIAFAASAGLRRGELLGLRWTDLDLGDRPSLTIRRMVKSHDGIEGGRIVIEEEIGKTDASLRAFPLSAAEAMILRLRRDHQRQQARAWEAVWSPHAYVWPREMQLYEYQNPERATRAVGRIRDRAGVPDDIAPLHGLRHRSVRSLLGLAPMEAISARVGHADTRTTSTMYAEAEGEHMDEIAKVAGERWRTAIAGMFAPKVVG